MTAHANECFAEIEATELRVYIVDQIESDTYGSNICNRSLNIHLLKDDNEYLFQKYLICERVGMAKLSKTERLLKCIVSDNLEYYIIRFIGGNFLICRLDRAKNSLIFLYSSNAHSSLKLSLQYPNANECIVVDATGRPVFTLNMAGGEAKMLIPAEGRSCVIM